MSGVAILLDKPGLPILKSKWALPLCRHPAKRLILVSVGGENHDRIAVAPQIGKSSRDRYDGVCSSW
jgi:hypothetical protein